MLKAAYIFSIFNFSFYKKSFNILIIFKHNRGDCEANFIDNAIHNTVSNQCLNLPFIYFMYPMIVYPHILCQKKYIM